jgi:hypothetical protein
VSAPSKASGNKPLTPKMLDALRLARVNDGVVFAGVDYKREPGGRHRMVRTPASVLLGLERRGLATCQIGPDGGMMARLTPEGRLLASATKEGDPMSIAGLVTR